MEVKAAVCALAGLFFGCQVQPPATPPTITPQPFDASTIPTFDAGEQPAPSPQLALCQTACGRLNAVGCKEGTMADCAQVLCAINAEPIFEHYNLPCLATATDVIAINACGGPCTQ